MFLRFHIYVKMIITSLLFFGMSTIGAAEPLPGFAVNKVLEATGSWAGPMSYTSPGSFLMAFLPDDDDFGQRDDFSPEYRLTFDMSLVGIRNTLDYKLGREMLSNMFPWDEKWESDWYRRIELENPTMGSLGRSRFGRSSFGRSSFGREPGKVYIRSRTTFNRENFTGFNRALGNLDRPSGPSGWLSSDDLGFDKFNIIGEFEWNNFELPSDDLPSPMQRTLNGTYSFRLYKMNQEFKYITLHDIPEEDINELATVWAGSCTTIEPGIDDHTGSVNIEFTHTIKNEFIAEFSFELSTLSNGFNLDMIAILDEGLVRLSRENGTDYFTGELEIKGGMIEGWVKAFERNVAGDEKLRYTFEFSIPRE